jgi:hypothetical protein
LIKREFYTYNLKMNLARWQPPYMKNTTSRLFALAKRCKDQKFIKELHVNREALYAG